MSEQAGMAPYEADPRCPKCGICSSAEIDKRSAIGCRVDAEGGRLNMLCVRCGWKWVMTPADASDGSEGSDQADGAEMYASDAVARTDSRVLAALEAALGSQSWTVVVEGTHPRYRVATLRAQPPTEAAMPGPHSRNTLRQALGELLRQLSGAPLAATGANTAGDIGLVRGG